ncbi:MAG: hypothetical protein FJ314_08030 [SAR202 cluster bacterium]|nr:hypothetical protein [SAR202 cluster bacterium]
MASGSRLVVDSHQHFWDIRRLSYEWMGAGASPLKRNFLPRDLKPLVEDAGVDRTVIVQAHQSMEETDWILGLARRHAFIGGTVCWVDLTARDLGRTLDRLQKDRYFNGVRHNWHGEADERWAVRTPVVKGLRELAARGIPFDLLTFPQHLKHVVDLYERIPSLKGVVDHISKPAIAKFQMEPWARDIAAVAEIPGVFCKVSGMVTEARHNWEPADLRPYVEHVVNAFGYERLMFGSDWPVCTLAGTYRQVFDSARSALGRMPARVRDDVFGGNAVKFYGLAS